MVIKDMHLCSSPHFKMLRSSDIDCWFTWIVLDTVHLFPVQVLTYSDRLSERSLHLLCYFGILIKILQALQTSLLVVE